MVAWAALSDPIQQTGEVIRTNHYHGETQIRTIKKRTAATTKETGSNTCAWAAKNILIGWTLSLKLLGVCPDALQLNRTGMSG